MSEAIYVEGLAKAYNGKNVVNHLDLSVKSGTIRLLGQNPKKHRRTLFERIGVQFQEGDYLQLSDNDALC